MGGSADSSGNTYADGYVDLAAVTGLSDSIRALQAFLQRLKQQGMTSLPAYLTHVWRARGTFGALEARARSVCDCLQRVLDGCTCVPAAQLAAAFESYPSEPIRGMTSALEVIGTLDPQRLPLTPPPVVSYALLIVSPFVTGTITIV